MTLKDNKQQLLKPEARKHYAENRFLCKCKTDQCKLCKAAPYHLGYTCEGFLNLKHSKTCRYCQTIINNPVHKEKAFHDVCGQKECADLMKIACNKILPCGHPCCGYRGEKKCTPCLFPECEKRVKANRTLLYQTGDDYCNICFVEGLIQQPCVKLKCGHLYHQ